jgi:hypothetical protein
MRRRPVYVILNAYIRPVLVIVAKSRAGRNLNLVQERELVSPWWLHKIDAYPIPK